MTYKEFLEGHKLEKPDLKEFDIATVDSPNPVSYGKNGYVVIPKSMPLDYYNDYYEFLDDSPVGGITFGGYLMIDDGDLKVSYLDSKNLGFLQPELDDEDLESIEKIKSHCIRVIGFDNQHAFPNELNAYDGAKYISSQLEQHFYKLKLQEMHTFETD